MNKTDVLNDYYKLIRKKNEIHPHSREGFFLAHFLTFKFFIDNYKVRLIKTQFTHNAISENIDDLQEIFKEVQKYEFINETLFSKERYILSLIHQTFYNLFQLNIKHKKVHSIPWKYFPMEKAKKMKLNCALFVLNTGGNHIPLKREYKLLKNIMKKRFPFKTKYELIENTQKKWNEKKPKKRAFIIILLFIKLMFIKLYCEIF